MATFMSKVTAGKKAAVGNVRSGLPFSSQNVFYGKNGEKSVLLP
jgi:hypothetical protein